MLNELHIFSIHVTMIIKEEFMDLGGMAQEVLNEKKRRSRVDAVLLFEVFQK